MARSHTTLFIFIHYNSIKQQLIKTVNYCMFYYAIISAAKVYNVHIMVELVLPFSILLLLD